MTSLFLLQLLNGVQLGVLLFLIAAGLTLVFGIMDFVNLAHGVIYMVGAYLVVMFASMTGSYGLGLLLTLPATLVIGLVLEALIFRRLYDRPHLDQVLATFGLVMVVTELVKIIWGQSPLSILPPDALSGSVPLVGALRYPVFRLVVIAAGLAVAVDIGRLFTVIFAFGAMLAGFAGAMVAPILSVDPGMGESVLILAFVVIVIGGIGSVKGAFAGALLVGIVDTLGRSFGPIILRAVMEPSAAAQTGRVLAPMLVYVLMAAILAARPQGLFGARP